MHIQEIEYPEILAIRKEVLYPDATDNDICKLDDDNMGLHLGVVDKSETIGAVSIFLKDRKIQFRKLAIKEKYQKKKYGSDVLKWIYDYATEMEFDYIWANARKNALDFYLKNGFHATEDTFDKNGLEYVVVIKDIVKKEVL